MKNFRKTIIALATAAAMLVPSVAMAAGTITATIEDAAVEGTVYAGFYQGDVLVKAELGGTTEVKTETTTVGGSTEEAPLTQPVVSAKVTENAGIKKLTFTATPDADMGIIEAAAAIFSYDSTVVVPEEDAFVFFTDPYNENSIATNSTVKTYEDGDRVVVKAEGATAGGGGFALNAAGVNVIEFNFTVAEGKEITADTFKIEDDYAANPVLTQVYGDPTSSTATGLFLGTSNDYVRYGAWDNGADTLTWLGFDLGKEIAVTDKIKVIMEDSYYAASEDGDVHKLTVSAKAPAGLDEMDIVAMDISLDPTVVTAVKAADGTIPKNYTTKANAKAPFTFMEGYATYNDISWNVDDASKYTVTIDVYNEEEDPLDYTEKTEILSIYYIVNDGQTVDEDTFSIDTIEFRNWDEEAVYDVTNVEFADSPWKAAETITTTKTVITVNDVVAPAEYDNIKVFVWDNNQVAQCAPVAGKLN